MYGLDVGGGSRMLPINGGSVYIHICVGWMAGGGSRNDARQDMKGTR